MAKLNLYKFHTAAEDLEGYHKVMTDNPEMALEQAKLKKERDHFLESILYKDVSTGVKYATRVLNKRWPKLEEVILEAVDEPRNSLDFYSAVALYTKKLVGEWPEAEGLLARNPYSATSYAQHVLKGRFPRAEPVIVRHPYYAAPYAIHQMNERWPDAEAYMLKELKEEYNNNVPDYINRYLDYFHIRYNREAEKFESVYDNPLVPKPK